MAYAKVTTKKVTRTVKRVKRGSSTSSSGGTKRCPACGRYMSSGSSGSK